MFYTNGTYSAEHPAAEFFSTQILTTEWADPVDAMNAVYPVAVSGDGTVTAYALDRPDGQWSVLLVNKDPNHDHTITLTFHDTAMGLNQVFGGAVRMVSFGVDNYTWHANGANGYASPDGPATILSLASDGATFTLPRGSLTVLRGFLPAKQSPASRPMDLPTPASVPATSSRKPQPQVAKDLTDVFFALAAQEPIDAWPISDRTSIQTSPWDNKEERRFSGAEAVPAPASGIRAVSYSFARSTKSCVHAPRSVGVDQKSVELFFFLN
jgi:hypothetical protein